MDVFVCPSPERGSYEKEGFEMNSFAFFPNAAYLKSQFSVRPATWQQPQMFSAFLTSDFLHYYPVLFSMLNNRGVFSID